MRYTIGHQFALSHSNETSTNLFSCRFYARGGQEAMFYDSGLVGNPLNRRLESNSNHFILELVNQQGPRQFEVPRNMSFSIGQVVWKVYSTSNYTGWHLEMEEGGPFVIVGRRFDRYALVNNYGILYPQAVPVEQLLPYTSTWHVARFPTTLRNHAAIHDILDFQHADE